MRRDDWPKIITIDGPAASGKSTLGKLLAEYLGYLFFDTGVMYRAVTWAAILHHLPINSEKAITRLANKVHIDVSPPSQEDGRSYDVILDGLDITWEIRQTEVDANVSVISAYPGVRKALSVVQRRIGMRGEVVMVGRDIGTVVLPEADLKFFLDASVEERARRRYNEVQGRGEKITFKTIFSSMLKRDQIDSTRDVAPLCPAVDAIVLNTDGLGIDQVFERMKAFMKERSG